MESLELSLNILSYINESWSTLAADRLFNVFALLVDTQTPMITTNTDRFGMIWDMFRFFGATIFVAFLAWYATKKMVLSQGTSRKTNNLSIIESIGVGGQSIVRLIKAGDKYLLIGVTKERITLLAEIDNEQIADQEPPDFSKLDTPFGKILSRFIKPGDGGTK